MKRWPIIPLLLLSALLAAGCGPAPQQTAYTATLGLERVQPEEVIDLLADDGLTLTPLAVTDDALDAAGHRPSLYETPARNGYLLIYDFDTPARRNELIRDIPLNLAQSVTSRYGLAPEEATASYQPDRYIQQNPTSQGICCRNLLLLYILRQPDVQQHAAYYRYPSRSAQLIYERYYALFDDTQTQRQDDVTFTLTQQLGGYWWADVEAKRKYFDGWWSCQLLTQNHLPLAVTGEQVTGAGITWKNRSSTTYTLSVAPEPIAFYEASYTYCHNNSIPPAFHPLEVTAYFPNRAPVTVIFTLPPDKRVWPASDVYKRQVHWLRQLSGCVSAAVHC